MLIFPQFTIHLSPVSILVTYEGVLKLEIFVFIFNL